jgi:hypothetical protein
VTSVTVAVSAEFRALWRQRARWALPARHGVRGIPPGGSGRTCPRRLRRQPASPFVVRPPIRERCPLLKPRPWAPQPGLAAQPLPGRPARGRAGLRRSRAARQCQRRRPRVGHHLAVTAQSFHPPRPRHAGPQPRGYPAAGDRRPPAHRAASHPGPDPVFVALNPGALPARERSPVELYHWVRCDEEYATWAPTWSSS